MGSIPPHKFDVGRLKSQYGYNRHPMTGKTTLPPASTHGIAERLRSANRVFALRYPGETGERQPVHVLYGGAHLFKRDSAAKLGAHALRALEEHAPDPAAFARIFEMPEELAAIVHPRVVEKLSREPVEDYRIDFEDGYGLRSDEEEDGHALAAAREMAAGLAARSLPPFCGLRIKALTEETRGRAVRTLDLFLTALGPLPPGFVVTLPKVTNPEQVAALADLCDLFEPALGLPAGALKLEIMVETPQALTDLLILAETAQGRCVAAHFGAYDYTAALGITSTYQSLRHPASDFARQTMQNALAGTGIRLADGATTILPVAPNLETPWKIHYEDVWRSLVLGFYQSWDLHPGQLVSRYAATYGFFYEVTEQAAHRLRNFLDQAARATRLGQNFDDAATGQGLLNSFLRAVHCGALTEEEALERSGLTLEELRGKSFGKILERRS
jgi:citrate lyase beta subunit